MSNRKGRKQMLVRQLLFTIIAYLISAMFGNSMYYTSPYFFILLGMLYKQEIMDGNSLPKKS